MNTKIQRVPSFRAHPDASALAEVFRGLKVGDEITYASITERLGYDARSGKGRSRIYAARAIALREYGIVLAVIFNFGFQRLDDSGIVKLGESEVSRAHRRAKKSLRAMKCVIDVTTLDEDSRRRYEASCAQIMALQLVSHKTAKKRLSSQDQDITMPSKILSILAAQDEDEAR